MCLSRTYCLRSRSSREAIPPAESALAFALETRSASLEADAELMLGDAQIQLGSQEELEPHYQRSLEAAHLGPYYDGVVAAESRLAELARRRKDLYQEFQHLTPAIRMIEADRMRIPTPELRTGFTRQVSGVYEAAIENRVASRAIRWRR